METSLSSLSIELLNLIISFCDDLPSLAKLARTSKQFHQIILPHLYAHLSIVRDSDFGVEHLRPVTLLMLQNPQRAAMVKRFTLPDGYETEHQDVAESEDGDEDPELPWQRWPRHPDLDLVLRSAITDQLGRVGNARMSDEDDKSVEEKIEHWFKIARASYNEAAILALLLPNLVNLQSMDVAFQRELWGIGKNAPSYGITYFVRHMFERASIETGIEQDRQPFGRLTDLMLIDHDDKYPDSTEFLGACMNLPALKRLYARNAGDKERPATVGAAFDRLRPGSASVEMIHLRKCKLCAPNLSKLLQAPKSLKTFIYELGNTWAWTDVEFSKMKLALDVQRHSLERLCLSHDTFYPFMDFDELQPLVFSEYTSLKHFRTAPVYLYGGDRLRLEYREPEPATKEEIASTRSLLVESLPPNIETLRIEYCDIRPAMDRLAASLEEVLMHKEEKFTSLQEVCVHTSNGEVFDKVLEAFTVLPWKAKDIHFLVKYQSSVDYDRGDHDIEWQWGWDEDVQWARCVNNYRGRIEVRYDSRNDRD